MLIPSDVVAMEPTQVDGAVSIDVDSSKPVWPVTVTNRSEDTLSYEMMGKVPRGLGLELWEDEGSGVRIHAEDLAESLNVDGFPADIREIPPGKSEVFQLDPRSMSATDATALAKWRRAERLGSYQCRVVFGVYSSRLITVSPPERRRVRKDEDQTEDAPPPVPDGEELFGLRLRRMLDGKKLALVDWNLGSDNEDEHHLTYTTCAKDDFERMAPWDGSSAAGKAMHELVAAARERARRDFPQCTFEGLMVQPCEDDPSKRFVSVWFRDRSLPAWDDITIHLLLNGAATKTTRLPVTAEQAGELSEYRIPKLPGHRGAGKPAPESKPEDGRASQPESEKPSR